MKTRMNARLNDAGKVEIKLFYQDIDGFKTHEDVADALIAQYPETIQLGFHAQHAELIAMAEATPAACAPFAAFAEKIGIKIIQL
ncbi:MAG: hypothetical protein WC455_15980 [Dehalococcoidia bacterium]